MMAVRFRSTPDMGCYIPVGYLQTARDPHAQQAYTAKLQRDARGHIYRTLGLDTSAVQVHVLAGPPCWDRPFTSNRQLGPFLFALSQVPPFSRPPSCKTNRSLAGFHYGGRVYLNIFRGAFDLEVITHELLHGVSRQFSGQAHHNRYHALVEGLTEFFTNQVIFALTGANIDAAHSAYQRPALFIEQLSKKVGREKLAEFFFSNDPRPLDRLLAALGPKNARWFHEKAALLERVTMNLGE